ncbi:MAG TPA: hypothetical protein DIC35_05525 [Candidatus Moranbacteria bacterium]|nr:hypothetical protein [Candidatus Moranbacteria bacterium]
MKVMNVTFERLVNETTELARLAGVVNSNPVLCIFGDRMADERPVQAHFDLVRARIDNLIRRGQEYAVQKFVRECLSRELRHFAIERLIDFKKTISPEELGVFFDVLTRQDEHPESEKTQRLLQRVFHAADAVVINSGIVAAIQARSGKTKEAVN